jgi:hypothetical protein
MRGGRDSRNAIFIDPIVLQSALTSSDSQSERR